MAIEPINFNQLPAEIGAHIFSFKAELDRTSLVCRRWLAMTDVSIGQTFGRMHSSGCYPLSIRLITEIQAAHPPGTSNRALCAAIVAWCTEHGGPALSLPNCNALFRVENILNNLNLMAIQPRITAQLPPPTNQILASANVHLFRAFLTTNSLPIRALDLSRLALRDLPGEVGLLNQLITLNLNTNQLATLPASIRRLTGLTELYLNENQFTSFPKEIVTLSNLEKLSLGHNQLPSLPSEIGQLKLKELRLHQNQLTSLPHTLGDLTGLELLGLSNNQLKVLPPAIGQLHELQNLNLYHNHLTSLPNIFQSLTKLRLLYIIGNHLTSLPDELRQLPSLSVVFDVQIPLNECDQCRPSDVLPPPPPPAPTLWQEFLAYGYGLWMEYTDPES